MSLLGFVLKNVLSFRFRLPLSVLRLHHGATLQSAVEGTVDLHCKTLCFNQLFCDVNILNKNVNASCKVLVQCFMN